MFDLQTTLKVASIQMKSEPGNVTFNIEKAFKLIEEAKNKNAELIVLPELFDVGYDFTVLKSLEYNSDKTIEELSEMARKMNICIAAGILEKSKNKKFNSVIVVDNSGEIKTRYRKINLFPLSGEKEFFSPGTEISTFLLKKFKIGIMICYDIRFPELSREYFTNGCSALIVSSAFPYPRLEHWNVLLKARAIENQSYIIAANRVGNDGDLNFVGHSCIIDPWGNILGILNESQEDVLVQEIGLDKVNRVRELIPCSKDKLWLNTVLK